MKEELATMKILKEFLKTLKKEQSLLPCMCRGEFSNKKSLFTTFSLPQGFAGEWGSIILSFWLNNDETNKFESVIPFKTNLKDFLSQIKKSDIILIWATIDHKDCQTISIKVHAERIIVKVNNLKFILIDGDEIFKYFSEMFEKNLFKTFQQN